jgi:hypothetical protein
MSPWNKPRDPSKAITGALGDQDGLPSSAGPSVSRLGPAIAGKELQGDGYGQWVENVSLHGTLHEERGAGSRAPPILA